MKGRHLLLTGALIAAGGLGFNLARKRYHVWHEQEIEDLAGHSQVVQTAQGPIEYSMSGNGGPALLLVHGSPGGYDQGVSLAALLDPDRSYTHLSVSRPGYLRTPLSSGATPEEQADLYAALLDTLDIRQIYVIALSGGGPSALQFALRYPERCQGLILLSCVAQHYSEEEMWWRLPPLKGLFARIYAQITKLDSVMQLALLLARVLPLGEQEQTLLRTTALYSQRRIGYENDMQQFERITRYPLARITAPTFVMQGTDDEDVSFADAELLAREIPGALLMAIPHGSHLSFYTHAETVMPAIRHFLDNTHEEHTSNTNQTTAS